ncbi:MAG: hypothetical protein WC960_07395 [Bacteroidales bacterium]
MGRWSKTKRIISISLLHLMGITPIVLYLYFLTTEDSRRERELLCSKIEIVIKDSTENKFIGREEIESILKERRVVEGVTKIASLDLNMLEREMEERDGVLRSEISYSSDGVLRVKVEQRRAIIRLEMGESRFFIDREGYIIPKGERVAYLPVVSSSHPLPYPSNHFGYIEQDDPFLFGIYKLALFLERERGWNKLIDQIESDQNGSLILYPRVGKSIIIFGPPKNIEDKFALLKEFYRKVAPLKGWDMYKSVDIRFKDQLVCKKR